MSALQVVIHRIASEPKSWSAYADNVPAICTEFELTPSEASIIHTILQKPALLQSLLSPSGLQALARKQLNNNWVPPVEV